MGARWKSAVTEVEDLLDSCVKADLRLADLGKRCQVAGSFERNDIQMGQEAMVRSRMDRTGPSFDPRGVKTTSERKVELLELRQELSKCTAELEAEGIDFDDVAIDGSGAPMSPGAARQISTSMLQR